MSLTRLRDNGLGTIGTLMVNGEFECFTLENPHHEVKVMGDTRIPEGVYVIKLRPHGGLHKKYSSKIGGLHKGMLWLQNVDNFEWVYIHIGNKVEQTDGCILVGNNCNATGNFIGSSTNAYTELYKKAVNAFDKGEKVTIHIA